jgi:signal transduction histidine kinase
MAIANSIRESLEKIHHHGKRADSIVKGMLEHSKVDTGQIEPTDINKLVTESLRLSYNAFCAKDNSFSTSCETIFDENMPKISVMPQALERVLVNLLSNAFYAVREKKARAGQDYHPAVSVITMAGDNSVLINVSDNGTGIPQKILSKIFQPFFTTKPTGDGTGLGLSLSYDIIRVHGGELSAESVEGEGTTFTIRLPL